jgi:fused signal recognition particle receptor
MFDNLRKSLKKFTGEVAEDAKLEDAPAAPPPAPAPAPAARPAPPPKAPPPPAKPETKFEVLEEDDDDLLDDELKAEIAALEKEAPVVKAAPPAPSAPRPAPSAPPAAPVRQAPKAPAPQPVAPAGAGTPKGRAIQLDKIDDLLWDLELSLLESDVALPVVEAIKETLKKNLENVRVGSPDEVPAAVERALRDALLQALSVKPIDFDAWILERTMARKPVVIMFVGVNGTGKTTSIGRIAYRLKENGFTSVMAAGDTFRAGAIQQLEKHAEKVGVSLIKTQPGGDPAAVAYDAIEHAKGRMKDVVLLDTAGRMQTNTNLMDEMKKIKRVAKPDLIVFVGDSLAGNDAVEQAVQFDKAVGIDAVILTKVDTDAKGGAALSIAKAVGKPVLFLGVGQEYGDIVPYDPQWMVDRIFEAA